MRTRIEPQIARGPLFTRDSFVLNLFVEVWLSHGGQPSSPALLHISRPQGVPRANPFRFDRGAGMVLAATPLKRQF